MGSACGRTRANTLSAAAATAEIELARDNRVMGDEELHDITSTFGANGASVQVALGQLADSLNRAVSPAYLLLAIYETRGIVYRGKQPYLVVSRRAW